MPSPCPSSTEEDSSMTTTSTPTTTTMATVNGIKREANLTNNSSSSSSSSTTSSSNERMKKEPVLSNSNSSTQPVMDQLTSLSSNHSSRCSSSHSLSPNSSNHSVNSMSPTSSSSPNLPVTTTSTNNSNFNSALSSLSQLSQSIGSTGTGNTINHIHSSSSLKLHSHQRQGMTVASSGSNHVNSINDSKGGSSSSGAPGLKSLESPEKTVETTGQTPGSSGSSGSRSSSRSSSSPSDTQATRPATGSLTVKQEPEAGLVTSNKSSNYQSTSSLTSATSSASATSNSKTTITPVKSHPSSGSCKSVTAAQTNSSLPKSKDSSPVLPPIGSSHASMAAAMTAGGISPFHPMHPLSHGHFTPPAMASPSSGLTSGLPPTSPGSSFLQSQDLLRRELDARFLASQDRSIAIPPPPYMRPGGPPSDPMAAASLLSFDKLNKLDPLYPRGLFPPSSSAPNSTSLLPGFNPLTNGSGVGFNTAGPFAPPGHLAAFQPKQNNNNSQTSPNLTALSSLNNPLGSTSSSPTSLLNNHKNNSPSKPSSPGRWCAMHVRIAWEIYHNQSKIHPSLRAELGGLSSKDPLAALTAAASQVREGGKTTSKSTSFPSLNLSSSTAINASANSSLTTMTTSTAGAKGSLITPTITPSSSESSVHRPMTSLFPPPSVPPSTSRISDPLPFSASLMSAAGRAAASGSLDPLAQFYARSPFGSNGPNPFHPALLGPHAGAYFASPGGHSAAAAAALMMPPPPSSLQTVGPSPTPNPLQQSQGYPSGVPSSHHANHAGSSALHEQWVMRAAGLQSSRQRSPSGSASTPGSSSWGGLKAEADRSSASNSDHHHHPNQSNNHHHPNNHGHGSSGHSSHHRSSSEESSSKRVKSPRNSSLKDHHGHHSSSLHDNNKSSSMSSHQSSSHRNGLSDHNHHGSESRKRDNSSAFGSSSSSKVSKLDHSSSALNGSSHNNNSNLLPPHLRGSPSSLPLHHQLSQSMTGMHPSLVPPGMSTPASSSHPGSLRPGETRSPSVTPFGPPSSTAPSFWGSFLTPPGGSLANPSLPMGHPGLIPGLPHPHHNPFAGPTGPSPHHGLLPPSHHHFHGPSMFGATGFPNPFAPPPFGGLFDRYNILNSSGGGAPITTKLKPGDKL